MTGGSHQFGDSRSLNLPSPKYVKGPPYNPVHILSPHTAEQPMFYIPYTTRGVILCLHTEDSQQIFVFDDLHQSMKQN